MTSTRTVLAAAIALLALHAQSGAQNLRPFSISATQTVTYESNVAKAVAGSETSDTVSNTGLRVGLDQPIGRQRLFGSVGASYNKYSSASRLDNTSYGVNAGLDWATIENISGRIEASGSQNRADPNPGDAPLLSGKNLERAHSASALARLGIPGTSTLVIEGSVNRRGVEYSAPEFAYRESTTDGGGANLRYRISGATHVGTGFVVERTRYPNAIQISPGVFTSDNSDTQRVDLTASWQPTGASSFDARLSYTKAEFGIATARNFSGATGALSWTWKPTGLVTLTTAFARDAGQEQLFRRLLTDQTLNVTDTSRVSDSVRLSGIWDATAKIQVMAGLGYLRRTLVDTLAIGGAGVGALTSNDSQTEATLGARWMPTRILSFGCDLARITRTAASGLSSAYDSDRFGCFGRVSLD